ncbi:SnoaL-like domain-containing protein [uncultured Croceitalea sp.]|uniref:SnoaL-like domain-containing protein n=1 Tax=uncultured Croceitalea sp. TaxID=1798908 RepID=UPI00374F1582
MSTQEVANRLVELCRKGQNMQAVQELYGKNIVSKEISGSPNELTHGFDAVTKKVENFLASIEEFHGVEVSDPNVAENHFSCAMKMDLTFKEQGRVTMNEINVYKVEDGKIVEEQFFY